MAYTQVTVYRRINPGPGQRLVDPSMFDISEPFSAVEHAIRAITDELDGQYEVTGRKEICSVTVITESTDMDIAGFATSLHEKLRKAALTWPPVLRRGDGSPDCVHDWQDERDGHADLQ